MREAHEHEYLARVPSEILGQLVDSDQTTRQVVFPKPTLLQDTPIGELWTIDTDDYYLTFATHGTMITLRYFRGKSKGVMRHIGQTYDLTNPNSIPQLTSVIERCIRHPLMVLSEA
jgi:hypothetical protein